VGRGTPLSTPTPFGASILALDLGACGASSSPQLACAVLNNDLRKSPAERYFNDVPSI